MNLAQFMKRNFHKGKARKRRMERKSGGAEVTADVDGWLEGLVGWAGWEGSVLPTEGFFPFRDA